MLYLNDDIEHFNFEAALPLLSDQRREQALKFKFELGRKTCAAAYLLLCEGLQKEYGITERPVFEYGEHGKPFIIGHPDIHFNLSHCREAVICAISDRPVGVDVESIREYSDSLARYTMNDDELALINRHVTGENSTGKHSTRAQTPCAEERTGNFSPCAIEFIRLWTMKEAKLKLSGRGITDNMKQVLEGTEHFHTVVNEEKGYIYSVLFDQD